MKMVVSDLVDKVNSKQYFNADVDVAVLEDLSKVFNIPTIEKLDDDYKLKNALLIQVGLTVLAQFEDRDS